MKSAAVSFDIAIEWENAKFAGLARARRLLRGLCAQLVALAPARPPEILMLYDPREIARETVSAVVDEEFGSAEAPARIRLVAAEGARYYEQKNRAAALCAAAVIVFVDCDVVPEDAWLAAILAPFAQPDVNVVYGQTYVEPGGLYAKSTAIYWFYPVRNPSSELPPTTFFYANNVAFRREFFRRNPFPDMPICRGQCAVLRERLKARGIGLVTRDDAVVLHPPPNGIRHFVLEAIHEGHGEVHMAAALNHDKYTYPLRTVLASWRWSLGECARKLRAHRRVLGLGFFGGLTALALGFAYYTLKLLGAVVTLIWPDMVPRLLPMETPSAIKSAAEAEATPAPGPPAFADISLDIVVPTYRRPADLDWLLGRLRHQVAGNPSRRVIVVNDGSHDATYAAVVERHRDIAAYHVMPANRGPAAARNLGAAHATHDWLVFIDDDCEPPPYWLDWLCATIADNADADAIGGTTRPLPSSIRRRVPGLIADGGFFPQPVLHDGQLLMLVTANLAVRRNAFTLVGGFDESMITTEDRNLTYRLGRGGAVLHLDHGWFVYHDMTGSLWSHFRRYYGYGVGNRRQFAVESDAPDRGRWPDDQRGWFYWWHRAGTCWLRAAARRTLRAYAWPRRLLGQAVGAITFLVMDLGFARGARRVRPR